MINALFLVVLLNIELVEYKYVCFKQDNQSDKTLLELNLGET